MLFKGFFPLFPWTLYALQTLCVAMAFSTRRTTSGTSLPPMELKYFVCKTKTIYFTHPLHFPAKIRSRVLPCKNKEQSSALQLLTIFL